MANPLAIRKAYFDSAQRVAEIIRGDGWESLALWEKEALRDAPESVHARLTAELAEYAIALAARIEALEALNKRLSSLEGAVYELERGKDRYCEDDE
jgi:hypothetical protein